MTLPSLDVFISLITIYIVLALTVSALTEIITRLVGLRSIGLKSGIRSILQDPNVKGLTDETALQRFDSAGPGAVQGGPGREQSRLSVLVSGLVIRFAFNQRLISISKGPL